MFKVVSIIMILMMVMNSGICGFAETTEYPTYGEAEEMMKEWITIHGYEDYLTETVDEDGFKQYIGMLCADEFEKETGLVCTVENWRDWSMNYYEDFVYLDVKVVGEVEGNYVYYAEGVTESSHLADLYTKVKVLFMITTW